MINGNVNVLFEKDGIRYEVLRDGYLEKTATRVASTFSLSEPMTKAIGITSDEFYSFAHLYCEKAIKDELSLVAREPKTDDIVGFHISEDFTTEPPRGLEIVSDKFCPIMALLQKLDEKYEQTIEVEKGKVFHLFMGGVSEEYEGRHILTRLIEQGLKLAKMKKYSVAVGEATGLASQHVLLDVFGFASKFAIEYSSFKHDGKNVFAALRDAHTCILVEKILS